MAAIKTIAPVVTVRGYATVLAGVAVFILLLAIAGFVISNSRVLEHASEEQGELAIVESNAYGSVITLRVKNISSIPVKTDSVSFFVNHIFAGDCASLSCPSVVKPGETFTVRLNGSCGSVVTVDFMGKRSSSIVSSCFPPIYECNDCNTCRKALYDLNNAGPAIVKLTSDFTVDPSQVLNYACIYLSDLNLEGVIFEGSGHIIDANNIATAIRLVNVRGLEIQNVRILDGNWNGVSISGGEGVSVKNVNVTGSTRACIYISGARDFYLSGSFENCGTTGYACIFVSSSSGDIYASAKACGRSCVYVTDSEGVRVEGNFENAGLGYSGIEFYLSSGIVGDSNAFSNTYGLRLVDSNIFVDAENEVSLCNNTDQLYLSNSSLSCLGGFIRGYDPDIPATCPIRPC